MQCVMVNHSDKTLQNYHLALHLHSGQPRFLVFQITVWVLGQSYCHKPTESYRTSTRQQLGGRHYGAITC